MKTHTAAELNLRKDRVKDLLCRFFKDLLRPEGAAVILEMASGALDQLNSVSAKFIEKVWGAGSINDLINLKNVFLADIRALTFSMNGSEIDAAAAAGLLNKIEQLEKDMNLLFIPGERISSSPSQSDSADRADEVGQRQRYLTDIRDFIDQVMILDKKEACTSVWQKLSRIVMDYFSAERSIGFADLEALSVEFSSLSAYRMRSFIKLYKSRIFQVAKSKRKSERAEVVKQLRTNITKLAITARLLHSPA